MSRIAIPWDQAQPGDWMLGYGKEVQMGPEAEKYRHVFAALSPDIRCERDVPDEPKVGTWTAEPGIWRCAEGLGHHSLDEFCLYSKTKRPPLPETEEARPRAKDWSSAYGKRRKTTSTQPQEGGDGLDQASAFLDDLDGCQNKPVKGLVDQLGNPYRADPIKLDWLWETLIEVLPTTHHCLINNIKQAAREAGYEAP